MNTLIEGKPGQLVHAYRVSCDRAYSIWETGQGYSWQPWGHDTEYYKGDDEDIVMAIPTDARISESNGGQAMMYYQGQAYTAQEAFDVGLAKPQQGLALLPLAACTVACGCLDI